MPVKDYPNPFEILEKKMNEILFEIEKLKTDLSKEKKRILTPEDLEREYNYKLCSQPNLRSSGRLPYIKDGRKIFYDRVAVEKYILEKSERY